MINNYLGFANKMTGNARWFRGMFIAAALLVAGASQGLADFLWVTALEVEEGTYAPEDPVPMLIAITSTHETEVACYEVHVHLTPDVNFRTETDHVIHVLAGGIEPGETIVRTWTQMMPGNLPGTFFVDAEVTTCHGTDPAMSSPNSRLASAFLVETAKITLIPSEYPETNLISVTQGEGQSNGNSQQASVSADGRFVAFASEGSSLLGFMRDEEGEIVEDEDNNPVGLIGNTHADIFVKDHWTGEIERISAPLGAADADGPSFQPRISADGQWVAFHSSAQNLMPGINNSRHNVFLRDRESGVLRRLSVSPTGEQGNQSSQNASVSEDGRFVVFESEATNLLPGDTNNVADIFLYDREAGQIVRRVNVTNDGVQAQGGHSRFPRISADGRHVVFESRANNLTGDPDSGVWEIYVHDRNANETFEVVTDVDGIEQTRGRFDEPGGTRTRRLSVSFDALGNPLFSDGHSRSADLSHDGRYVVFQSDSTQLFADPAEGAIILPGRGAEAEVRWSENEEAIATIAFDPSGRLAEGEIGFITNPSDGHYVEISDGSTTHRFEFDGPVPTGVAPGNIQVIIGAQTVTRNNLVAAINDAFSAEDEEVGTIRAVADDNLDGSGLMGVHLTNLAFGPPEANQEIVVSGDASSALVAQGMSGATEADDPVRSGDELEIDHGRTPPVTVRFYEEGEADPTDIDARILGVEIGNNAKETSLNLFEVFQGLGYHEFDENFVPALPDYLLPPLMENPEHGTSFTLRQGDEGDVDFIEETFIFADSGPQFDPSDPTRIRIGDTPEETRGNLLRAIFFLGFTFDPLPAVNEATGEDVVFGELFADGAARGAVILTEVPDDGHRIIIGDGFFETTFRFDDERDLTEEEEEFGIEEVPPFEVIGPGLVRVYLVSDMTLDQINARLLGAIQASFLNITAGMGFSPELEMQAIVLLNNRVGELGNVPIQIIPMPEEDEEAEEPEDPNLVVADWALAYGMTGGEDNNPEAGDRIVFYPENLLHPRVVFEFVHDLDNLSADADFGIQIGLVGATTEGNLLDAIHRSGLPWLVAELPEDRDLPNVRLRSIIATGDGKIAFNFLASNPGSFACLGDCPGDRDGRVHMPLHGGTLTLDDGTNPPVVFEFTFNGTVSDEDHIPVLIAPVGALTRDNLIHAINQTQHLAIRAEDATEPAEDPLDADELVVRLINMNRGPVGDIAEGNNLGPITVTNVDPGGWNPRPGEAFRIGDGAGTTVVFEFVLPGQSPEAGRIGIETAAGTGDDRAAIRDRIINAIKNTDLEIVALPGTEDGNPAVLLRHNIPGPAGNVPIQILTPNPSFVVRGMSGGRFLGTGQEQIYLVDRDANNNGTLDQPGHVSLELISITEEGDPGNRLSLEPAISGDGRYVAFRTQASDLQPRVVVRSDGERFPNRFDLFSFESDEIVHFTDVDDFSDIYVRDREELVNRRVSVNRFGESLVGGSIRANAPRSSRGAAINFDGRFIAFETDDEAYHVAHRGGINDANIIGGGMAHTITNRNPLDFNDHRDIMIHDRRFPTDLGPMPGSVEVSLPGIVQTETVTVGTPVEIEAKVGDLLGGRVPAFVQFFANGELIGVASQPVVPGGDVFSIRWIPSLPGTYQIVAVATDSRGRSLPLSEVMTITAVASSGARPALGIISPPLEEDRVPENAFELTNRSVWPFVAVVGGGQHPVEEVEFFIRNLTPVEVADNEIFENLGGVSLGSATREPGGDTWRLVVDLSSPFGPEDGPLPPGFYVVRAVARDTAGNLGVSDSMPIVVFPGVYERPSVRLSSNRREFNRMELTRFRAQADSEQGQIETGDDDSGEVFLFGNGFLVDYPDFDNPQTERPFVWEGLALFTGTWDFYAVARDTAGNTSMSNVVRITIHPFGHIVRDPSDADNPEAFVFQVFDDLLQHSPESREPTATVVKHFATALELGEKTRGQVVVDVMTHADFKVVEWVIVTYLTVLRDFPTVEQLREGLDLLTFGDEETPGEDDLVLGPNVPVLLPLLVFDILDSHAFWIKHGEFGTSMDQDDLLELLHRGKTHPIRQQRLLEMENIGRVNYLTQLTVEKFPEERDLALRGALILMLLDRDIVPGEHAALPKRLADAAQFVVTRSAFARRFDGSRSFLKAMGDGIGGLNESEWFGAFGDLYFDHSREVGWLQHEEHGWIYFAPESETPNGVWMWDHIRQDWMWTGENIYPMFYSNKEGRWLLYRGGSPGAREFRFHDGNDWSAIFTVKP